MNCPNNCGTKLAKNGTNNSTGVMRLSCNTCHKAGRKWLWSTKQMQAEYLREQRADRIVRDMVNKT